MNLKYENYEVKDSGWNKFR